MLKQILQSTVQPSAALTSQAASPQVVWMNEWARLMLDAYEPGKTVVYTSCYAFPGELLAAFDVAQFDFELAVAMFGLTGSAIPRLTEAEDRGCPMDMCSLHRLALGGVFRDEFPKPDLLITTSYYCDQKTKTNDIIARLYGAEPLLLEAPSAVTADSVRYVEKQLRHIAERIAEVAGQRLDEDRLKEAVRSSNRARRSHLTLLELLKHRPAPWSDVVLIVYSIQARQFAGTPVLERLNQAFVQNMEQRIATAQLKPERHRVFWFAWVPVYATNIFEVFNAHQVSIPNCETLKVHWDEIDEQKPFEGLALKCLKNPFVGPHTQRVEGLETIWTNTTSMGHSCSPRRPVDTPTAPTDCSRTRWQISTSRCSPSIWISATDASTRPSRPGPGWRASSRSWNSETPGRGRHLSNERWTQLDVLPGPGHRQSVLRRGPDRRRRRRGRRQLVGRSDRSAQQRGHRTGAQGRPRSRPAPHDARDASRDRG
jgi:benzoyl-CoA reductase/2-hydroxyglutaryl-CoA dehydratase subunit BcrC/BadD/HgdB